MFTGLIEAVVPVLSVERHASGARLALAEPSDLDGWDPRAGESLCVSGCCLTLAGIDRPDRPNRSNRLGALRFDLSAETLERTWFTEAAPGRRVNLERALRLSDRLGGHLVSGHVDGIGRIAAVEDSRDGGSRFAFEGPAGFERYLIEKGSVCVDGISLTVVAPRGARFEVAVVPETLARTNLGGARVGQRVHLEADLIGKWIERFVCRV